MSKSDITWEQAVVLLRNNINARELVQACYYDDPLLEAAQRYHSCPEWQAVRSFLPSPRSDATVLDIGSGRGISAFAFACDGWNTFALEPDPSSIVGSNAIRSLSAESKLNINVFEEWGESLPFENNFFDIVHCRAVLHHARDLNALMREVARVLKPNGTFAGIREHVVSLHEDIPKFQALHPLHTLYGGEYAYLLREYKHAIIQAGLTLTKIVNPMGSNVNTAPGTMEGIKKRWAQRLGLPVLALAIPDTLLMLRAALDNTPGRLYSFFAVKGS